MRGISPLISAVLLIAIIFSLATIISPWLLGLSNDVTNQTTTSVNNQIECQSAAYDFDNDFASGGVDHNFSGSGDEEYLKAKIINTGTISLWDFSFEIEINETLIKHFDINDTTQKTAALPLKPGQSVILRANLTENLNNSLTQVRVLNGVCPANAIKKEI